MIASVTANNGILIKKKVDAFGFRNNYGERSCPFSRSRLLRGVASGCFHLFVRFSVVLNRFTNGFCVFSGN